MNARAAVVLVAALALAALTARLGVWQLDRADQKNTLQAAIEQRRALPALPVESLARDPQALPGQLHRRVELQGRWMAAATVYLENRQMNGRPGFFVVTPLQLADGTAVAVQRGWQPRDLMERTRVAPPPTPEGRVTLVGRIAPPPARLYEFGADAAGPIRQNLELAVYSREAGVVLRPLSLLQLGDAAAPDGLLREWPAPAADVHKHYGYAFQWFALCALTLGLYVWFQILRPRRPRRRP